MARANEDAPSPKQVELNSGTQLKKYTTKQQMDGDDAYK